MWQSLPKAELHLHLEFAAGPQLIRELAHARGLQLPKEIFGPHESFAWRDFLHFLDVTEIVSQVIRTAEDYRAITYNYLKRSAEEGVIYCEVMPSPDHAALAGLPYNEMLAGIVQGIHEAHEEYGIIGRILMTCVRHFGVEKCEFVAKQVVENLHPWVVGFGMGGDEAGYPPGQFAKAYQIAAEAGLGCTVHAGEHVGPIGIWEAINTLPVTRLGHGVRAIEDADLIKALVHRGITLEIAPTSNVSLRVYSDYASHPFNALRKAGVQVTLNSDDPPYFATSIGNEYRVAAEEFGLTREELLAVTRQAIQSSFADADLKQQLMARV